MEYIKNKEKLDSQMMKISTIRKKQLIDKALKKSKGSN